jgi:hypothetical protein
MSKEPQKTTVQESEPDDWTAFERAVDVVVKSGPQHRKLHKSADKVRSSKTGAKRDSGARDG